MKSRIAFLLIFVFSISTSIYFINKQERQVWESWTDTLKTGRYTVSAYEYFFVWSESDRKAESDEERSLNGLFGLDKKDPPSLYQKMYNNLLISFALIVIAVLSLALLTANLKRRKRDALSS